MRSNATITKKWKYIVAGGALMLAVVLTALQTTANGKAQLTFGTPEEAGKALDRTAKTGDPNALVPVLGSDAKELVTTGDTESDKEAMRVFASKYERMNRWVDMTDGSEVLYIGADNFAFPVPLAKSSSGRWYFDGVAGAQEVRAREIGRNELLAIQATAAIADAEQVYSANSDSHEYAARIISSAGKQDGLYWPAQGAEAQSPLANLSEFPKSSLASLSPDQPFTIDGYTLRILAAQGDDAPGGAGSYIVNGKMTGGFAVLVAPVKYGETGIITFMISADGVVYGADFGPDTTTIAASIQEFNPTDDDWAPVE